MDDIVHGTSIRSFRVVFCMQIASLGTIIELVYYLDNLDICECHKPDPPPTPRPTHLYYEVARAPGIPGDLRSRELPDASRATP